MASRGQLVPDVLQGQRVGLQVTFRPTPIAFSAGEIPRLGEINDIATSDGVIVALYMARNVRGEGGPRLENAETRGSGVMVAPGIALCATHVIDEYIPRLLAGELLGLCLGFTREGMQLWKISHISRNENSDIAFLTLEPASALPGDASYRLAAMTTRVPEEGETLTCIGVRAGRELFEPALHLEGQMLISSGLVVQRFLQGRDRIMPWSMVVVDMPAHGGMSGGPVFDSRGLLVGLVSASFCMGEGEEPSPTYVSLLWPILGQGFPAGWHESLRARQETLLDMASNRLCGIEGVDRVRAKRDPSTGRIVTTYDPDGFRRALEANEK